MEEVIKIIAQFLNESCNFIIIKIFQVPADMILLRTTEKTGASFIRTDQLDGETDWKLRFSLVSGFSYVGVLVMLMVVVVLMVVVSDGVGDSGSDGGSDGGVGNGGVSDGDSGSES